jgi:hypothetical protein
MREKDYRHALETAPHPSGNHNIGSNLNLALAVWPAPVSPSLLPRLQARLLQLL